MDSHFAPDPTEKQSCVEDDGLQVVEQQPGLESYTPRSDGSGKEVHVEAASAAASDASLSTAAKSRRKRLWILGGGAAAILVTIAIVLGAVLGTLNSKPAAAPSNTSIDQSSTPASASLTKNLRVASTRGAFNGTGLTSVYADHKGFWGFLFYQDASGTIQAAQFKDPSNLQISIQATNPVNINAANGTALAAGHYNVSDIDHYQLIYVNRNNILADAWLDPKALNSQGNLSSNNSWTDGTLADLKFSVPTDNRVGMSLDVSRQWYGRTYNSFGARLVVGGTDGQLHQLSFDWASQTWASQTLRFDGSWAYSGLQLRSASDGGSGLNTTLYSATHDGTLEYRVQPHSGEDTLWPSGGNWQNPVLGRAVAARNSSAVASWDTTEGLFFPHQQGQLGFVGLDVADTTSSQFLGDITGFANSDVMGGTDMAFNSLDGKALLFYQPNGTSIGFKVYDGTTEKSGGTLVS